jgi:hypothetical protein
METWRSEVAKHLGLLFVLKTVFVIWTCIDRVLCNRKSSGTRGVALQILIRLPSVLIFFLFCSIVKHKNTYLKPREKVANERASEYDIYVDFPFSSVTISKPQQKWANQWVCSCVWDAWHLTFQKSSKFSSIEVTVLFKSVVFNIIFSKFRFHCEQIIVPWR